MQTAKPCITRAEPFYAAKTHQNDDTSFTIKTKNTLSDLCMNGHPQGGDSTLRLEQQLISSH